MNSFDDTEDFKKQLKQSFIDTDLAAEMEDHLGYPKHQKADRPNKRNGHTKKSVRSYTGYLALGVALNATKELPDMWLSENEDVKSWLSVLTELQSRGVQDILITCVDGLRASLMLLTPSTPMLRFSCVSYT